MTRRELVTSVLEGKRPDRVPVASLSIDNWLIADKGWSMNGLLDQPNYGADVLFETYKTLDLDLIWAGRGLPGIALEGIGAEYDHDCIGMSSELIKKPFQEIEEIYDLTVSECMDRLHNNHNYYRLIEQLKKVKAMAGDEYLIGIGGGGPISTAAMTVGIQDFMMLLIDEDYEEDINYTYRFCNELLKEMNKEFAEAGADLIFVSEPVCSGDLVSADIFRRLMLPALKENLKNMKEFYSYNLLHICGRVEDRISSLVGSGYQALSMDGNDFPHCIELTENDFSLMGNLSPVHTLLNKTEKEVYEESLALCRMTKGERFLIAPGCNIAPKTPAENIRAMGRASRDAAAQ